MKRTEKGKENERYDESNTFFWNTRQRKAKNKNKKRDHLHKCFVYSVANRDFDSLSITVLNESGHRSWTHSRRTHTPACKQNQEETNGIFTPSPKMKISVPHFFTRAMPLTYCISFKTRKQHHASCCHTIDHHHHHCHQFHFLSFQKFSTIIFHLKKAIINSL